MTVAKKKANKQNADTAPKRRARPGRPSKSDQLKYADTSRERLLAVAIDVFSEYGYQAVSTSQIAKQAGMAQSMVHYHFRTKERLWKTAIDHLMHELGRKFPIVRDELKDLDPVSRLKVMTRRFIKISATDVSLVRIVLHEGTVPSSRLRWFVRAYLAPGYDDFDTAVKAGIQAGLIKDMPVYAISQSIISIATYVFCVAPLVKEVHSVDVTTPETIDELADTILEIIFTGILK